MTDMPKIADIAGMQEMDEESKLPKFYGKYRGTVINNVDPMQMGRIQAMVPDVYGLIPSTWALPCLPMAGIQQGIYTVPMIGAGVWIEFEQGDPEYPIWTGCWYGSAAEVPPMALMATPATPNIVLQTSCQNTILVSGTPGAPTGITLKTTTGAAIIINDQGITITNGKGAIMTMVGNIIDFNVGALTIM